MAREKLRLVRAKKRAARNAKDEAYYEFIKKRDAEMELEDQEVQVDVDLVQPETVEVTEKVKEKVSARPAKTKRLKLRKSLGGGDGAHSALVPSDGRTMGMEVE